MAEQKKRLTQRTRKGRNTSMQRTVSAPPQIPEETHDSRSTHLRNIMYLAITGAVVLSILFGVPAYLQWKQGGEAATYRYNGFDFTPRDEGHITVWETLVSIEGKSYLLQFYHHPRETERVAVEPGITDLFLNVTTRPRRLYLTLPKDGGSTPVVAGVEISKVTGFQLGFLDIETRSALQEAPDGNRSDIAVVRCEQATSQAIVISFSIGNYNLIRRDDENPNCLRLSYTNANESILVADRLAYELLGIIPRQH